MHDHVISFRADFDIGGPKNTFVRTSIEPIQKAYPWDEPEVPGARSTMHMVHSAVKHERGLDWPKNGHEIYLITSPNTLNKWGETKAYRIVPGTGMSNPSHLTILNSTALGRSAAWSASDLWVLRNHPDSEPSSGHHLNTITPFDPLVDFEKMVDGEDTEEEDLVVYFNLGGHHIPTSQDIPNTLMHTSASSVMFVPFNYFDADVSRAVRQGVRIDRLGEPVATEGSIDQDKDEVRRPRHADGSSRHSSAHESNANAKSKKHKDQKVAYFGAHYSSPVTIEQEMLSPDLGHYFQGRVDGEIEDGRKTVKNHYGGGGGERPGSFVGQDLGALVNGETEVPDEDGG